jgi:D-arabinose 1-dehydrogenase-like Zn-dependent alcohol dehydrogenase
VRAVVFDEFGGRPSVREVPDPVPPPGGVLVRVAVTGLCRSDWHGWRGDDPGITVPHVPGHEFAGEIVAVGSGVSGWAAGDRVTAPFVYACGRCPHCLAGDQQVCAEQRQPGFTQWGSFAEYVTVDRAAVNLVRVPDAVSLPAAAVLGCRFGTAFRAVLDRGRVAPGEWLAVYGCGGVGLSAIMIGAAAGARVVAVDVAEPALELAARYGATVLIAGGAADPAAAVRDATGGGAHVSIDAVGTAQTCAASVRSLRRRGRHVQVGLFQAGGGTPPIPMDTVIAYELDLYGSHGLAAHAYPRLLGLVGAGALRPADLITGTLTLDETPAALTTMDSAGPAGIRVIRP